MKKLRILLVFFGLIALKTVVANGGTESKMGSKSTYDNRLRFSQQFSIDKQSCGADFDKECVVEQIYMITRHGSRFPTSKALKRMKKVGVDVGVSDEDGGLLTSTGEQELYALGKRMFRYISSLNLTDDWFTPPNYHPRHFDFTSSQKPRVLQSAFSFSMGFFEGLGNLSSLGFPSVAIKSNDLSNDKVLRFHKSCDSYQDKVRQMKIDLETAELGMLIKKFESIILKALESKSDLLDEVGFRPNEEVSMVDSVRILWEACQVETILGDFNYCRLFQDEGELVTILEFLFDAENHFFKGRADKLNLDMSCLLRDEITSFFTSSAKFKQKVLFRFAHAESILPLVAMLPVYHDEVDPFDLNATGIDYSRRWKTGLIAPMATNLLFEKLSCSGKNFVRLLHNEEEIPWCHHDVTSKEPCTLETFLEIFQHGECDFDATCAL